MSCVTSDKVVVENNSLSKDKIFDINPMLKIGIEEADDDPLKGGGGIAKGENRTVSALEGTKLKECSDRLRNMGRLELRSCIMEIIAFMVE